MNIKIIKKNHSLRIVLIGLMLVIFVSAAPAQLEQAPIPAQGFVSRLIEIKYSSELYLGTKLKLSATNEAGKDSVLAIYNTLRWKIDGLVYQLSADMIANNSPRRMRLINEWCLQQPANLTEKNIITAKTITSRKRIENYTKALYEIDLLFRENIFKHYYNNPKTLNLTTNVFYLLKDSYTIIQGLADMKTKQTMALVELLDHTRLLSPGEIGKLGK
jgi:hypothetical protein